MNWLTTNQEKSNIDILADFKKSVEYTPLDYLLCALGVTVEKTYFMSEDDYVKYKTALKQITIREMK